jgi:hypothetical protein
MHVQEEQTLQNGPGEPSEEVQQLSLETPEEQLKAQEAKHHEANKRKEQEHQQALKVQEEKLKAQEAKHRAVSEQKEHEHQQALKVQEEKLKAQEAKHRAVSGQKEQERQQALKVQEEKLKAQEAKHRAVSGQKEQERQQALKVHEEKLKAQEAKHHEANKRKEQEHQQALKVQEEKLKAQEAKHRAVSEQKEQEHQQELKAQQTANSAAKAKGGERQVVVEHPQGTYTKGAKAWSPLSEGDEEAKDGQPAKDGNEEEVEEEEMEEEEVEEEEEEVVIVAHEKKDLQRRRRRRRQGDFPPWCVVKIAQTGEQPTYTLATQTNGTVSADRRGGAEVGLESNGAQLMDAEDWWAEVRKWRKGGGSRGQGCEALREGGRIGDADADDDADDADDDDDDADGGYAGDDGDGDDEGGGDEDENEEERASDSDEAKEAYYKWLHDCVNVYLTPLREQARCRIERLHQEEQQKIEASWQNCVQQQQQQQQDEDKDEDEENEDEKQEQEQGQGQGAAVVIVDEDSESEEGEGEEGEDDGASMCSHKVGGGGSGRRTEGGMVGGVVPPLSPALNPLPCTGPRFARSMSSVQQVPTFDCDADPALGKDFRCLGLGAFITKHCSKWSHLGACIIRPPSEFVQGHVQQRLEEIDELATVTVSVQRLKRARGGVGGRGNDRGRSRGRGRGRGSQRGGGVFMRVEEGGQMAGEGAWRGSERRTAESEVTQDLTSGRFDKKCAKCKVQRKSMKWCREEAKHDAPDWGDNYPGVSSSNSCTGAQGGDSEKTIEEGSVDQAGAASRGAEWSAYDGSCEGGSNQITQLRMSVSEFREWSEERGGWSVSETIQKVGGAGVQSPRYAHDIAQNELLHVRGKQRANGVQPYGHGDGNAGDGAWEGWRLNEPAVSVLQQHALSTGENKAPVARESGTAATESGEISQRSSNVEMADGDGAGSSNSAVVSPSMGSSMGSSMGNSMAGIASSTFYLGSAGAMFCWHTEDLDLNSVNHLLEGASKVWWVVPPCYSRLFEQVVRRLLARENVHTYCKGGTHGSSDSDGCNACGGGDSTTSTFIRHKTTLITRERLLAEGVPVLQLEQPHGHLVVTAPGAYHAGLNTGFNVAESVNLCTPRWVDYGLSCRSCRCGVQWDWTSMGWAEWALALGQRQGVGCA